MKTLKISWLALVLTLPLLACDASHTDQPDKKEKKESQAISKNSEIEVLEKWEMPHMLREVSGIAFMDNNRFACVQDESGVIFIYNTEQEKIESEIDFGASGDYEGIALVKNMAYVVRSDGTIFEIDDINTTSPKIKEYQTALTAKNDVEGLTYYPKDNCLLLAIKGNEGGKADYKGIYAFDLKTKKLNPKPKIKIDLTSKILDKGKSKKLGSRLQPSEIAVHPLTGDIYVLEGTNPQLLVLDPSGDIRHRYQIKGSDFSQPEGMAFSPTGELYIANEGKKEKGNILKVRLN